VTGLLQMLTKEATQCGMKIYSRECSTFLGNRFHCVANAQPDILRYWFSFKSCNRFAGAQTARPH
jgi:hypothetical protein